MGSIDLSVEGTYPAAVILSMTVLNGLNDTTSACWLCSSKLAVGGAVGFATALSMCG